MAEDKTFVDATGKRRVTIFGSTPGGFTFLEERYSDDPYELCWIPLTHRRSQPICDSFETAIREAIGRVAWLAQMVDRA